MENPAKKPLIVIDDQPSFVDFGERRARRPVNVDALLVELGTMADVHLVTVESNEPINAESLWFSAPSFLTELFYPPQSTSSNITIKTCNQAT